MQFITGSDRHQMLFVTLDTQVSADNAVRLMDAFVDKLDLVKLGFALVFLKEEGRPYYERGVLLKLYLYGYLNKIRSSRKLEKTKTAHANEHRHGQHLQPHHMPASLRLG